MGRINNFLLVLTTLACQSLLCCVGDDSAINGCKLITVHPRETLRYFKAEIKGVSCYNPEEITGVQECRGYCKSGARYHSDGNSSYISQCSCCVPRQSAEIDVMFECRNGKVESLKMHIPSKCECKMCSTGIGNVAVPTPT